jgi:hypothetical protein
MFEAAENSQGRMDSNICKGQFRLWEADVGVREI